ncbi:hypothetical protein [Sanguibacter antarcticus]|uniref:Uncharacterized protein n=1 Tax=Sanguibacter antarcticus TaxID=372484 RepID=A0A2A9E261_9MICO|nr:hypothetical protein [Sanguibacter antarcticus]PFG33038.1 hypothetical protein ATL42_0890 [Sanguibacter antarcticus]
MTQQELEDVEHELALAPPAAHATPTRSQPVTVQITTASSARTRTRTEVDHRALARWILESEHQGLTTTGGVIERQHGCSKATD